MIAVRGIPCRKDDVDEVDAVRKQLIEALDQGVCREVGRRAVCESRRVDDVHDVVRMLDLDPVVGDGHLADRGGPHLRLHEAVESPRRALVHVDEAEVLAEHVGILQSADGQVRADLYRIDTVIRGGVAVLSSSRMVSVVPSAAANWTCVGLLPEVRAVMVTGAVLSKRTTSGVTWVPSKLTAPNAMVATR
ncbi:MAG: hypothetical protein IPO58_00195 [Betaproteobacteria bacterium]|nr:hypothetical protein [Betaproteobacteria bacterium]